jgi:simple sugar transport system ATP-binding protein
VANDHIDLTVEPGEVHALLGENGAGKSTLMNQLYGLLQPDEGEVLVDGEPRTFHSPRDAIRAGIGMVHQHFMLVPVFTVAENIALGAEETRGGPLGWLDRRRNRRDVLETSQRYGLPVDPDALVENLPVGAQQRVEIVKALTRDVDLLILDEPTAVLTPQETEELLAVMRGLSDSGKSIVFITHKLKEVKAIADRITVIRRGRTVAPSDHPTTALDRTEGSVSPDTPENELAALMVGRDVSLEVDKSPSEPGREVLKISGLIVDDDRGIRAVDAVDLVVRAGEVLGVAGVQGNGQTELVEAVMGLRAPRAGTIQLDNESLVGMSTKQILRSGVGYVPEDRSLDGVVKEFSVAENLVLDTYDRPPYGNAFRLNPAAIASSARERVEQFDIRTSSAESAVSTLSGGNQQKVVVAREMSRPLRLFIASQPTRGVDVGSIEFIHGRIVHERDVGTAVLVVSSELDEVVGLADRIAVMYRGRILAIVSPDTPREDIGLLMAGITDQEDAAPAPDPDALAPPREEPAPPRDEEPAPPRDEEPAPPREEEPAPAREEESDQ